MNDFGETFEPRAYTTRGHSLMRCKSSCELVLGFAIIARQLRTQPLFSTATYFFAMETREISVLRSHELREWASVHLYGIRCTTAAYRRSAIPT